MTREHAIAEREAFNAFCDGKEIQEKRINPSTGRESGWEDVSEPAWGSLCEHRIKPAPRMVPLLRGDYIVRKPEGRGLDGVISLRDDVASELGDCLWYIAGCATQIGLSLGDIACNNLAKLAQRKKLGTIKGSGDRR